MVAGSIRHSPVRQSARKGLGAQRQNNNNDNNLVRQEPQGEALVLPVDNFHPADAHPVQVLAPLCNQNKMHNKRKFGSKCATDSRSASTSFGT